MGLLHRDGNECVRWAFELHGLSAAEHSRAHTDLTGCQRDSSAREQPSSRYVGSLARPTVILLILRPRAVFAPLSADPDERFMGQTNGRERHPMREKTFGAIPYASFTPCPLINPPFPALFMRHILPTVCKLCISCRWE